MRDDDINDLEHQLRLAKEALSPEESELWNALNAFIKAQTAAGVSRERAYIRARNLLKTAANEKALRLRKSFRVVEPD